MSLAGNESFLACISTGVMGVGGSVGDRLFAGVHGRFLTGVAGRSGSVTEKARLKGHGVFSNCSI
jgi:hypothetical protein